MRVYRRVPIEPRSPYLLGGDGGPDVGVDGNLHAQVAADHAGDGSEDKGGGGVASTGVVPVGSGGDGHKDDGGEDNHEVGADGVLGLQEGVGAGVDGSVDLNETLGSVALGGASEGGGGRVCGRRAGERGKRGREEGD